MRYDWIKKLALRNMGNYYGTDLLQRDFRIACKMEQLYYQLVCIKQTGSIDDCVD